MSRKKGIHSIALEIGMDAIISPSSSSASSSSLGGGGRTIDRHNPIIRDSRRIGKSLTPTSSPINPKSYNQHEEQQNRSKFIKEEVVDYERKKNKETRELGHDHDFINPPTSSSSSRYLLNDSGLLPDTVSGFDPVPREKEKEEFSPSNLTTPLSSSSFESFPPDQVVVLGVSLHCKGCEGKVKKHISRMQGVKSFNIDFAAKKLTVIGDVTPLSVMATISKVRHAQISLPPLLDGCQ